MSNFNPFKSFKNLPEKPWFSRENFLPGEFRAPTTFLWDFQMLPEKLGAFFNSGTRSQEYPPRFTALFVSIVEVDTLSNIDEFKIAGESVHVLEIVLKN